MTANTPAPAVIRACEAEEVILRRVEALLQTKERVFVALDGRCCAGKSTLFGRVGEALGAPVLHMDDFYLQPEMRTPARLAEPGGNVDRERFLAEALLPLLNGDAINYRRWDCQKGEYAPAKRIEPDRVVLTEGAYSLHPDLRGYYDLCIFFNIEAQKQRARVLARNGAAGLDRFLERWIPLEERYFAACQPQACCELIVKA